MLMQTPVIVLLPALAAAAALNYGNHAHKRQLPGMPKMPDFFGVQRGANTVSTPYSVKILPPQIRKDAIHERVMFGPFTIKAANATHSGDGGTVRLDPNSDAITSRLSGLCQNCMVLKAGTEVVNQQDVKVGLSDGLYGHHILVTDIGAKSSFPPLRPDAACEAEQGAGFDVTDSGVLNMGPGMGGDHASKHDSPQPKAPAQPTFWGSTMNSLTRYLLHSLSEGGVAGAIFAQYFLPSVAILMGEGGEATSMTYGSKDQSIKSGFWIAEDHRLNAMAEIINYDNKDKNVWLSVDYEYLPNVGKTRPKGYNDISFGVLGVTCGRLDLHPDPKQATKFTGRATKVLSDGYIMGIVPHLHDGGINMTFSVNGQTKCTSEAVYGGANQSLSIGGQSWETITSYTPCADAIKVNRGDDIAISTVYDLSKHKLRPSSSMMGAEGEGMGLALFTFSKPTKD